jgi:TonB family protein
METLIVYLVKSAFCLTLFFIVFYFLFREKTHFSLNRLYLLSSMILSFIIPTLHNPFYKGIENNETTIFLDAITVTNTTFNESITNSLFENNLLFLIYFAGLIVFSLRFLIRIVRLIHFKKHFRSVKKGSKKIFYIQDDIPPFSFFNLIFIGSGHNSEDLDKIIAHETIHVRHWHSVDIILAEFLSVLQWFNPFAGMLKKAIRDNHEYIADSAVLSRGYDRRSYQNLILSVHFHVKPVQLTNNFNTSQIKRRIIMMTKVKSGLAAQFRFFLIVPLIIIMAAFIACNSNTKQTNAESDSLAVSEQTIPATEPAETDETVYEVVEELPTFGKSEADLMKYLQSNISYPAEARKKGIQGKVKVGFVVTKTGKVADVEVLESVNEMLDAEAIRVIASMPEWNPGRNQGNTVNVKYVLPVNFRLN